MPDGRSFVPVGNGDATGRRLYVFPHAGAGPAAVGVLAAELDTIDVRALNLPGRQARLTEPPRTALEPLVKDIAAELVDVDVPYALFGYCAGALLAYLVARHTSPRRLFVGSFAAPDVALVPRRLHTLPGEVFWDVVIAQGGVAPELAARTELRPVFEPALRADFELYAGYHHQPGAPLDVPITVLHGRDDGHLTRGGLLGWRRQSTVRPELCELPCGHWIMDDAPGPVASGIAERMPA